MKVKKRITAGLLALAMVFSLSMGSGWIRPEAEAADAAESELTLPASGTSNSVEWSIDENGHLEISGTGDWERRRIGYAHTAAPWYDYRALITSAKVTLRGATDLSDMFWGCSGLASLDVSDFDTSSVTSMYSMFDGCSGLTSLDLSGFDTRNVTDMGVIFTDCSGLTSLDLSGFNTSSVTNMRLMFGGCSGLTSLDLSGLDTSSVTDMCAMFSACSGLTSLELSGFDTSSVTDMSGMFFACGLTSLDLSGFDTSNVYDISSIFSSCSGLTSLDVSGFDTSNVTDMDTMFSGCSGLTSLDLSGFDTSNVTDMLDMFHGCSGLTSLDLSSFDTSSVTNMSYMFYGCSGLTSLDVSSFDTSSVTDMERMFYNCSGLTSLDLSSFDTSSVTDMSYMFYGCSSLTSIQAPLHVENPVTLPDGVWKDEENNAYENLPKNLDTSIVLIRRGLASGTSNQVEWSLDDNGHLEVSGTGDWKWNGGPPWKDYSASITSAKVTLSGATDLSYMFSDCRSLTSLDLSSLDTSGVTSMSSMFSDCRSLTSLDLSNFDTSSVTSMSSMFYNCFSLTSLDLSSFDTSSVTDMLRMFDGCSGLTSLDLSGFDTSSVTNMQDMFDGCSGLTSLDVSSFDTSSVTVMSSMFCGCSGLTSLDVSNFDTSSVTSMNWMFYNCSSLTSLDLSSFDTNSVTGMDRMFYNCSSLTSLDLSSFDTSSVTGMDRMFYGCSSLTSIQTPLHVKNKVTLPDGIWKDKEKNKYESLPENLDSSIVLRRYTTAEIAAEEKAAIAEAKTVVEAVLAEIEGDNDTSKESIQSIINKALTDAGITDVTATVDSFEKTEATSSQEGNITGSVTLTAGSESGKVEFEKTIEKLPKTNAEKIAEAKTVVEAALSGVKGDNDTTKESIQSIINKALTDAGITDVTATVDSFGKTEATSSNEGSLAGSVTLTTESESDKVDFEKTIEKLPKTDEEDPKTDEEEPKQPSEDDKKDDDNKTDTQEPTDPSTTPENDNKDNPDKTDTGDIATAESEKLNETAPDSEITDLSDEAKEAILAGLTEAEKAKYKAGERLYLYLQTEDVSNKISKKDKDKIDSVKGDLTVGMYLDITLLMKIGNMAGRPLPNPGGNVEVAIDLPPSLKNTDLSVNREFSIIHIHDGKSEVISARYDAKTNKLIFKTSGFSTFAIAYKDVPIGNAAGAGTTVENPAVATPKMGDETNVPLYSLLTLASAVGAGCAMRRMQNCKYRREH